jgi:hypothetical protein
MEVKARSKKGYYVDATLEELNLVSGLKVDKYGFGDTFEVNPKLALVETVAAKEALFNQKIATLKTDLEKL